MRGVMEHFDEKAMNFVMTCVMDIVMTREWSMLMTRSGSLVMRRPWRLVMRNLMENSDEMGHGAL